MAPSGGSGAGSVLVRCPHCGGKDQQCCVQNLLITNSLTLKNTHLAFYKVHFYLPSELCSCLGITGVQDVVVKEKKGGCNTL